MRSNVSFRKIRRILIFAVAAVAVIALAALWRYTPLGKQANEKVISEYIYSIRHYWWTPVMLLAGYCIAHTFLFPNTILNAAVILTIGGFHGWLYAILASLASATLFFFIGRRFGAIGIHIIEGRRLEMVRRTLARGGFGAVTLVRFAPVAPYSVVNTLAGAIGLRFADFIIGTFLAHIPGTLALALFGEQLSAAIARPTVRTIAAAIALLAIGAGVYWAIRRHAHKRLARVSRNTRQSDSESRAEKN